MKAITRFRKFDIIFQIILIPFLVFFFTSIGMFIIGTWQIISNIINIIYDLFHGGISVIRIIYTIVTLVTICFLAVALSQFFNDTIGKNMFLFLFAMFGIGPVLAGFYMYISVKEKYKAEPKDSSQ